MRLLIPTSEVKTIYKTDYLSKSKSVNDFKLKKGLLTQNKLKLSFNGKTQYQE